MPKHWKGDCRIDMLALGFAILRMKGRIGGPTSDHIERTISKTLHEAFRKDKQWIRKVLAPILHHKQPLKELIVGVQSPNDDSISLVGYDVHEVRFVNLRGTDVTPKAKAMIRKWITQEIAEAKPSKGAKEQADNGHVTTIAPAVKLASGLIVPRAEEQPALDSYVTDNGKNCCLAGQVIKRNLTEGEILSILQKHRMITSLALDHQDVTEAILRLLGDDHAGPPHLNVLHIPVPSVTDEGVGFLLRSVRLRQNLTQLGLSGSRISDDAFAKIAHKRDGFRNVMWLGISLSQFLTDASLDVLCDPDCLPQLRELHVEGNLLMTNGAVERLKQRRRMLIHSKGLLS